MLLQTVDLSALLLDQQIEFNGLLHLLVALRSTLMHRCKLVKYHRHGLVLRRSTELKLVGFCDADWATDPDDRRSTSSYCLYFGENLVSWHYKKQHTVSRSSTETEHRSLANLVAEITWVQSLRSG
ncbi:hypothetical protein TorRG33x02_085960 [Trema orientale]|uniref:Uncharacterized protein n=1 Tax=Trema orientale TaxID=63057 RepID=A0A2P5FD97_TREOI|nr:hypothetical protein TorRG33x02_085960 [Trema orientale]